MTLTDAPLLQRELVAPTRGMEIRHIFKGQTSGFFFCQSHHTIGQKIEVKFMPVDSSTMRRTERKRDCWILLLITGFHFAANRRNVSLEKSNVVETASGGMETFFFCADGICAAAALRVLCLCHRSPSLPSRLRGPEWGRGVSRLSGPKTRILGRLAACTWKKGLRKILPPSG